MDTTPTARTEGPQATLNFSTGQLQTSDKPAYPSDIAKSTERTTHQGSPAPRTSRQLPGIP
ncbi:hypothetical protein M407DRAFT_241321 [Tulasnella calospora MUT 4182]|uniref:Uncharacterized protein n=1 Tax=Tulasnella calospora MUT 4182 TaxID=1051891 RepID=A0A0C3LF50_9AGAM|nr:hypothetical protein M407DRAFT_241321 [Tulasnella calospora MUT 4182]